jgi:hypothetical protein
MLCSESVFVIENTKSSLFYVTFIGVFYLVPLISPVQSYQVDLKRYSSLSLSVIE